MRHGTRLCALLFLTLLPWHLGAQVYDTNVVSVQTFAGYGIAGYVDAQGLLAQFANPTQIVSDTASNLYVWDSGNARIRKVTPEGTVSTLVGGGAYFNGYGTNVSLAWGTGGALAIDHANTLWLVLVNGYGGSSYLLTITTNGYVTVENGGLTNLTTYSGLCVDSANNLYYSGGNRIYRYNPRSGAVQAIAGNGNPGHFDGQGPVYSQFNNPTALACDQADNIYVWDSGNGTIRRIDPSQNVTTVAGPGTGYYSPVDGVGTNASFNNITSLVSDHAGNLYLVCNSCVRKMDAQANVVTEAGVFEQYSGGFANGPGPAARFFNASGGCLAQGMLFVADSGNNLIRSLALNPQPQVLPPANLQLNTYPGVRITGTVGRTYRLESSPDMKSWAPKATVLLTASPYLWIDQAPVTQKSFYRAVMLP